MSPVNMLLFPNDCTLLSPLACCCPFRCLVMCVSHTCAMRPPARLRHHPHTTYTCPPPPFPSPPDILTELIWISFTLWPGLHEAAYRNGWSCGMRRYSLVIISEFVWAGFWLAMIVTMMIMKILWWLTLLTSVLGITLSLACVGLTVWLRVLTEREGETEEEVARVTVAIQTAQQSGKSSAAAGYKYLMQVSANRPGGRAGPAASMV